MQKKVGKGAKNIAIRLADRILNTRIEENEIRVIM